MLYLTLYSEYFYAIFNGIKTEEYRKNNPYWKKRIRDGHGVVLHDTIKFVNGYGSDRPWMIVELKDVSETKEQFILYLGEIIDCGNLKNLE